MKLTGHKSFRLISVTFAISVIMTLLHFTGALITVEQKFYDNRIQVMVPTSRPSDSIILVILDQDSLDWASETHGWSWPWPRSAYGDIVDYFSLANASSVAFDVLFSEPSLYGAQDDKAFASANTEYARTINAVHFLGNNLTQVRPIDTLAESTAIFASVLSAADSDGIIRRTRLFVEQDNQVFPTLGIAPLALEMTKDLTKKDIETIVKEHDIPLLKDGTMYLRYRRSIDEFIPYNARQILESLEAIKQGKEPLLPPDIFTDSYVFFGFSAPGLYDIAATSISSIYPGVGIHITMLDTILNKSYVQPTASWASILFIVLATFLGAFAFFSSEIIPSARKRRLILIIVTPLAFFLIAIFPYALFAFGWNIPLIVPLLGFILAFGISLFLSYKMEGRQKRYLKTAFRQYLSSVVIDELIAHPERLKLGGERREISIYFSDVQGFTSISEKLSPEDLTALLNDYLSEMSDIILDSGGTIDKYEGDAIIAFWNAPTEQENHARIALEVAVLCQERLSELRAEFEKRTGFPMHMRIGLNTGFAVVGNMGSHKRFDYTMIGDSVNLAARLEGLNKQFGTYIMTTEASKKATLATETFLKFRELGRVIPVGKKEAVRIFEPIRNTTYAERIATLTVFAQALELFYAGNFPQAQTLFATIADKDSSAAHYAEKCKTLALNPPNNWDGVWRATEK